MLGSFTDCYYKSNNKIKSNSKSNSNNQKTDLNLSENRVFNHNSTRDINFIQNIKSIDLSSNNLNVLHIKASQIICINEKTIKSSLKGNFKQINEIKASNNNLDTFPFIRDNDIILTKLDVEKNSISLFPVDSILYESYYNLKSLCLRGNCLKFIPTSIQILSELIELDISTNQISSLPLEFYKLYKLEVLKVNNNNLEELSYDILNLKKLKSQLKYVDFRSNKLKYPPQHTCNLGIPAIKDFFKSKKNKLSTDYNNSNQLIYQLNHFNLSLFSTKSSITKRELISFKILIVGHDHVGKSMIYNNLRKEFCDDEGIINTNTINNNINHSHSMNEYFKFDYETNAPQFGVETRQFSTSNKPEKARRSTTGSTSILEDYNIKFLILFGKEIYHSIHEIFFSSDCLYLIVWSLQACASHHFNNNSYNFNDNVTLDSTNEIEKAFDYYVQYWIDLIQSRAPGASIIIVGTHADYFTKDKLEHIKSIITDRFGYNEEYRMKSLDNRIINSTDNITKNNLQRLKEARESFHQNVTMVFTSNLYDNMDDDILPPNNKSYNSYHQSSYNHYNNNSSNNSKTSSVKLDRASTISSDDSIITNINPFMSCMPSWLNDIYSLSDKSPTISKPNTGCRALSIDTSIINLKDRIIHMSRPSESNPHPFGIVGIHIPIYYIDVKQCLDDLRNRHHQYCTFDTLLKMIQSRNIRLSDDFASNDFDNDYSYENQNNISKSTSGSSISSPIPIPSDHYKFETPSSNPAKGNSQSPHISNLERLKHVIAYYSSVGEILWINLTNHSRNNNDTNFQNIDHDDNISSIDYELISNFIFLDPKWLIDKIKTILDIKEKFNEDTSTWTWDDIASRIIDIHKLKHIKSDSSIHINDNVNISLIKPSDISDISFDNEVKVIMGILHHYGVIVPMNRSNNYVTSSTKIQNSRSSRNIRDIHGNKSFDIYLIPSLISTTFNLENAYLNDIASVTFERQFKFDNFTPSGLIYKVLSKLHNNLKHQHYYNNYELKTYKDAFILKFPSNPNIEHFRVCVWLSSDGTSDSNKISNMQHYQDDSILLSTLLLSSKLRIIAKGVLFAKNFIQYLLHEISNIVKLVLSDLPGLVSLLESVAVCPSCLMDVSKNVNNKQSYGEFTDSYLQQLEYRLKLCENDEFELRAWSNSLCICPSDPNCNVMPNQLIHIPNNINNKIEKLINSDHKLQHILDEIVISSIDQKIIKNVSNSTVKIAICNNISDNNDKILLQLLQLCSGVLLDLRTSNERESSLNYPLTVLTCEHVITQANLQKDSSSRDTPSSSSKLVFENLYNSDHKNIMCLIGDESNWLFTAKIIFKGSESMYNQSKFWDVMALQLNHSIESIPIKFNCTNSVGQISCLPFSINPNYTLGLLNTNSKISLSCSFLYSSKESILNPVVVNQVVCLMGYPHIDTLSIDYGRVEKSDKSEILVNVISDKGASGGPLMDRYGYVIGILSRSFDYKKYSSIEPLFNIKDIIRNFYTSNNAKIE